MARCLRIFSGSRNKVNVIAFSPHPDDAEVLMGGTIAKYTQKGHNVMIVLATIPEQKKVRLSESKKAAALLGATFLFLDLDPHQLTFNRRLVSTIDRVLEDYLPDVIYTSWIHDSHQDHVAIAQATIAASRKNKCSVYMGEQALPSGIVPFHFRAQAFVDISDTIELKIQSVLAHKSQVQSFTQQWIEGIRARAIFSGFQINVKYAEVFEVVKELKRI